MSHLPGKGFIYLYIYCTPPSPPVAVFWKSPATGGNWHGELLPDIVLCSLLALKNPVQSCGKAAARQLPAGLRDQSLAAGTDSSCPCAAGISFLLEAGVLLSETRLCVSSFETHLGWRHGLFPIGSEMWKHVSG